MQVAPGILTTRGIQRGLAPLSPLGACAHPGWAAAPVVFALFRFCRIKLNKALRALKPQVVCMSVEPR